MRYMDLSVPEYAYMLGFLHGDGHLSTSGGKLRLRVELAEHRSVVWNVSRRETLRALVDAGMPAGSKSATVRPPPQLAASADYWRGLVDADGSVGVSGAGLPFLLLGTKSVHLAAAFASFLGLSLERRFNIPNGTKRDGYMTFAVWKEDAQQIARLMYREESLCLPRKRESANGVLAWTRPEAMRRRGPKAPAWDDESEQVLADAYDASDEEIANVLGRSVSAIRVRRSLIRRECV